MIVEDIVRTGVGALTAHKMRSALNLLGIVIAVMTIVAVISVVSGLNKYAADVISGLGPNTLIFTKFGIIRSREAFLDALKRKDITQADLEAVRRLVPQALRVAGRVTSMHPVFAGGRRLADTFVLGAEYEFPWMIGLNLQDGRFASEAEAGAGRAVAVIGWDVK
ncbi:MAG TPA: ABC transporter permease, partial [Thermoanaerobaculaceae bacterium]|nr:ABC transporter permease [Thermoanaerobaculaceae bacterium]